MNDKLKERWVARDGSIYTVKVYSFKGFGGTVYEATKSISFNVGEEVAQHIVNLHNASLEHEDVNRG